MTEIDLPSVAPNLLQAIGLSLPTIAIFVTLGGAKEGREGSEVMSFAISLASLLLVVMAAGILVFYMAIYRGDWLFYSAVTLYIASLFSLGVSTLFIIIGRVRKS